MKPRVAFLIPYLGVGGAERVASELSFALDDFEFNAVVFRDGGGFAFNGATHILQLELDDDESKLRKLCRIQAAAIKLGLLMETEDFDAMVSFTTPANLLAMLTPTRARRLVTVHTTESALITGRFGFVVKNAVRRLYPRADRILAVSQAAAIDLRQSFDITNDVEVIHNPVNSSNISHQVSKPLSSGWEAMFAGGPVVSCMGRFVPPKGHWHLLRAFRLLKEQLPGAKLVLLGDGPLRGQLQEECSRLRLEWASEPIRDRDVYFAGFQQNPFNFIASSDLFVFPSRVEGLGNALIEAMACRVPVVASDCYSGPREIMTDMCPELPRISRPTKFPYGTLMPPWPLAEPFAMDPQAARLEELWAFEIKEWIQKGSEQAGSAARERSMRFDSERLWPRWQRLIELLLSE
jgi:glycosyltransferase involved in cell wall biosynthesis